LFSIFKYYFGVPKPIAYNAKDCIRSGAQRNSVYNLVERSRNLLAMGIQKAILPPKSLNIL